MTATVDGFEHGHECGQEEVVVIEAKQPSSGIYFYGNYGRRPHRSASSTEETPELDMPLPRMD
ncbi:hypothetical protein [Kutzneria sp. NPDC052558]|uniref:hypothetical protein n=1 Tax=Kutzneria sp. NPDC052558 TaxID=3364121 RepID=UPI0037C5A891